MSSPTATSSVPIGGRRTTSTQVLAEALVMIAIAGVLSLFRIFTLPEAGSVTLGSTVPIFVLSFRRGPKVGMAAGLCLGLIVLIIEPFVINPIQFILDYPLPFSLLGIAGFFRKWPVVGVGAGIAGRFTCHFLSGALFFCSYMPPVFKSCPVYSAVYQASYLVPEFFIASIIVVILQRRHILAAGK
jgi:thiamine transporter